jgi:hypothetical protein
MLGRNGEACAFTGSQSPGLSAKSIILRRASDRQALGDPRAGQGTFADLQGGFVILAPLIASAAAAFLPH